MRPSGREQTGSPAGTVGVRDTGRCGLRSWSYDGGVSGDRKGQEQVLLNNVIEEMARKSKVKVPSAPSKPSSDCTKGERSVLQPPSLWHNERFLLRRMCKFGGLHFCFLHSMYSFGVYIFFQ
jgi:hypothetical protein